MEYKKFSRLSKQELSNLLAESSRRESKLYSLALKDGMGEEVMEIVREKVAIITMSYLNAKVPDEITRDFARYVYFSVDQTGEMNFYKNSSRKIKETEELLKIMRAYTKWHARIIKEE